MPPPPEATFFRSVVPPPGRPAAALSKIAALAAMLACAVSGMAAPAATAPVGQTVLSIGGIEKEAGILLVAVYADNATWLGKSPLVGLNIPAKPGPDGRVTVTIPGTLPPKIAVAVIHDINGNRDMDRNAVGIPKEPYGFSRGVRPRFGPPGFEDALVPSGGLIPVVVDTLL